MVVKSAVLSAPGDPLSALMLPSPTETPEERNQRLGEEKEAKRVSDAIDEELNIERKAVKPVKILLLGQSESGKSTTLKNFQLMHEPKAFARERVVWRAIIQLNVVRCFHLILDAMQQAVGDGLRGKDGDDGETPEDLPKLTTQHLKIKRRLSPLLELESILINQLSPVNGKEATQSTEDTLSLSLKEVAVNSATQWKECLARIVKGQKSGSESSEDLVWDCPSDPGRVLNACCEDMVQLWNDPTIRDLLTKLRIRMEDHSGFFLDSLERVTALQYLPTDGDVDDISMCIFIIDNPVDDILRARLKTLGVTEHRFRVSIGAGGRGKDWRVYDVGGHRSQRAAWVPYFDDLDAIIFLAPISAFDQMLEEDPKVNRLLDSFQLWTQIVSNELLGHTNIILFLNKFDIFSAKITAGVCMRDYVTSFRDRPNDIEAASTYIRKKFAGLLKSHSKLPRVFYAHFTTVTDPKSTKYILSGLQDMVMRQNLADCDLT